jgi:hypothetical protein
MTISIRWVSISLSIPNHQNFNTLIRQLRFKLMNRDFGYSLRQDNKRKVRINPPCLDPILTLNINKLKLIMSNSNSLIRHASFGIIIIPYRLDFYLAVALRPNTCPSDNHFRL